MNSVPDLKLLQAIVEQSPDAVIFADREGLIRLWNRAAEKLFGYCAAEVVDTSLDIIIPERFRNAHWTGYRRAIASGETKYGNRVLTTRSSRKDGATLYVELAFALLKDGHGNVAGALATARDGTERYLAGRARAHPERSADG